MAMAKDDNKTLSDDDRKQRLRGAVATGLCIGVAATVVFAAIYSTASNDPNLSRALPFVLGIGLAVILMIAATRYLDTGFKNSVEKIYIDHLSPKTVRELAKIGINLSDANTTNDFSRSSINQKIDDLRTQLVDLRSETQFNKEVDVENLKAQLVEEVLKSGSEELLARAEMKFAYGFEQFSQFNRINETFEESKERLSDAISRLERKGNFNLILGGATTSLGVALLGFSVFFKQANYQTLDVFMMAFLPRLSVVIILQVFSFFFLKLYKSNIDDVKYLQNEITNVEHKQVAVNSAIKLNEDEHWRDLLSNLMKTERNQILEKGQTTVKLEQSRLEAMGPQIEALAKLATLFKK